MSGSATEPALALRDVSKVYPGVRALDRVSIELTACEIHGIVGENGAGKSTLVKIVSGGIAPDEGTVELRGQPVVLDGPWDARRRGIAVVHQEFQSLLSLSVAENVLLGASEVTRGFVRWGAVRRAARQALAGIGVDIDVRAELGSLAPAQRKLVEIARAVHEEADVLLLDEPTAALEADDVARLFDAIRRLRDRGVAVAFVGHRLDEILALCDRVTVLRDGRIVGSWPAAALTAERLVEEMVGRRLDAFFSEHAVPRRAVTLEVRGLAVRRALHGIDFDVHEGEVLGVAGLVGSGRTELGRALFGAVRATDGTVAIDGRRIRLRSPLDAVHAGIAYVPANRQADGLVYTMDIRRNISLAVLRRLRGRMLLDVHGERRLAVEFFKRLRVVARGVDHAVETLSGGNQQKVLLARWLAARPKVLVLDEPTQGIDVGAKAEIHRLIADLADEGLAIVLMSSDLPELVAMSDRVLVLRRGSVAATLPRGAATEERIVVAAVGAEAV